MPARDSGGAGAPSHARRKGGAAALVTISVFIIPGCPIELRSAVDERAGEVNLGEGDADGLRGGLEVVSREADGRDGDLDECDLVVNGRDGEVNWVRRVAN